jgi:hypothetical protein
MQHDHTEDKGAIQKREYRAPLLTRYGALRDLTQSGSGTSNETNGSGGKVATKKPASDRNVKENIIRIGEHPLGMALYVFEYKPEFRDQWGHGRQFGVMAQEVETILPEAVCMHPDGYKIVDYAMLGIVRTLQ